MPDYEGTVIRPPSEAGSLIFQVTLGCSDNKCIFCPAYKDKPFRVKDINLIENEFRRASKHYPETRKIFLADGDALVIEQEKLKSILLLAKKYFPLLARVSAYGSVKSLEHKSIEQLSELKSLGLGMVYLGFETGDEDVYGFIKKYGSPEGNVEACVKLKSAGIKVNVTVIAGLGGKKLSHAHAVNTAKILNLSQPNQIAVLTLMIAPDTPLFEIKEKGGFEELNSFGIIEEIKMLIENLGDFKCQFFANHASNYYPIVARFPNDKDKVVQQLDYILKGRSESQFTPDSLRGL